MYSKISILIVLVISSFFFSACNDDPTSAGLPALGKEDLITVNPDSSFLVSSSSFNSKVDFFASDPILLGSYNGTKSTMLVNLYLSMPDTIKTGILNNTVSVQNAWIDMYPYYTIGSAAASDDFFKLKKITSGWPSTVNFNADSLGNIIKDETDLKTATNFSTSLYSFGVSASNVSSWLKDTSKSTVGLYFEPNAGSQKMVGFHPYYSTDLTYSMRMKVVFVKSGVYSDTVTFYPATDLHVVQGNGIQRPANRICVQGGIGLHSSLQFEMPKSIPLEATINNAQLELTWDQAQSNYGSPMDSTLNVMFLTDPTTHSYDSTRVLKLNKYGNIFKGDISYFVQKWIGKTKSPNYGVAIGLENEKGKVDMLAFMGSDSPYKPKLKIVYTAKKP